MPDQSFGIIALRGTQAGIFAVLYHHVVNGMELHTALMYVVGTMSSLLTHSQYPATHIDAMGTILSATASKMSYGVLLLC